jgi:hypothetical protein
MDNSFIKEQADRCRRVAENADQFTKRRLLDLAAKYDDRLDRPSRALRTVTVPASLREANLPLTRRLISVNGWKQPFEDPILLPDGK